jgi:predicted class III extradiol MEMO1 family dioxygenase
MLHCPLDSSGQAVSYTYNKPADDAPGTTVVVSCSRHMIMKKPVILGVQKDGKMSTPMPVTPAK